VKMPDLKRSIDKNTNDKSSAEKNIPKQIKIFSQQLTFRRFAIIGFFLVLIVLSFLVIKPFISALLAAAIFAYMLFPIHKWFSERLRSKSLSALIICVLVILVLVLLIWLIAQFLLKDTFNLYMSIQKLDLPTIIDKILSVFLSSSSEVGRQVTVTIQSTVISLIAKLMITIGDMLEKSPQIILGLFITFFGLYYFLRDGEALKQQIIELLPFRKKIKEQFYSKFKRITKGVIFGSIVVGLIQGIVAGIGFFIFQAPSPLLLTFLAIFISILPLIGPWLVWLPVSIVMIAQGNVFFGILLLVYGLSVVSTVDNIIRPMIVGKRAKISEMVVLIGMLGGLPIFGIVGLVIGPMILEFLLTLLDYYRKGGIENL